MLKGDGILELQDLINMKPDTIFLTGVIEDSPAGINMERNYKQIRWVAVRGGIEDWAIYYGLEQISVEAISRWGNKVIGEKWIRKLVQCTDEAFGKYRY